MDYAYEDNHIRIRPLTINFSVRELREGVYNILLVSRGGEFSVQCSPKLDEIRTNPVAIILTGLCTSLSDSPYAPASECTVTGGRDSLRGHRILVVTPDEKEHSFQYGVCTNEYWLDIRGYTKLKTGLSIAEISNWITEGIEVISKRDL